MTRNTRDPVIKRTYKREKSMSNFRICFAAAAAAGEEGHFLWPMTRCLHTQTTRDARNTRDPVINSTYAEKKYV